MSSKLEKVLENEDGTTTDSCMLKLTALIIENTSEKFFTCCCKNKICRKHLWDWMEENILKKEEK